jgi:hypothetical protein
MRGKWGTFKNHKSFVVSGNLHWKNKGGNFGFVFSVQNLEMAVANYFAVLKVLHHGHPQQYVQKN